MRLNAAVTFFFFFFFFFCFSLFWKKVCAPPPPHFSVPSYATASIYSTHDFVPNVYSILGKEGICDMRLFWYWLLCLCSGNIYSYICHACCLNHPIYVQVFCLVLYFAEYPMEALLED